MGTKVSVITVCYNAEASIGNTLKSVLEQTYKDFEYLSLFSISLLMHTLTKTTEQSQTLLKLIYINIIIK